MDFSLQLLPEQPLAELIDVVRLADELGFRGCYSADETYHKDMWILFGAAAPRTRRIRFGPEVSGVILRDPTLIAQQAATLDELTNGRAEIVFSVGNIAMLEQYGIRWQGTRPLARLREAHEIMRTFLAEGRIDRRWRSRRLCPLSRRPGLRGAERSRRSRTGRTPARPRLRSLRVRARRDLQRLRGGEGGGPRGGGLMPALRA
jgi:alkanesulfonate monooxygenase SsuD/methylene tetrahydromethanopterin reductase-like flavin-dependent oxidoreductase (luciferase family)